MLATVCAGFENPFLPERNQGHEEENEKQRGVVRFQFAHAVAKAARCFVPMDVPPSVIPGADTIDDGWHRGVLARPGKFGRSGHAALSRNLPRRASGWKGRSSSCRAEPSQLF